MKQMPSEQIQIQSTICIAVLMCCGGSRESLIREYRIYCIFPRLELTIQNLFVPLCSEGGYVITCFKWFFVSLFMTQTTKLGTCLLMFERNILGCLAAL